MMINLLQKPKSFKKKALTALHFIEGKWINMVGWILAPHSWCQKYPLLFCMHSCRQWIVSKGVGTASGIFTMSSCLFWTVRKCMFSINLPVLPTMHIFSIWFAAVLMKDQNWLLTWKRMGLNWYSIIHLCIRVVFLQIGTKGMNCQTQIGSQIVW